MEKEGLRRHPMRPRSPPMLQSQQESQAGHLAQQTWLTSLGGCIPFVNLSAGQSHSDTKEEVQCLSPQKWGKGQQGHLSIASRIESVLQAKRTSGKWKEAGSQASLEIQGTARQAGTLETWWDSEVGGGTDSSVA